MAALLGATLCVSATAATLNVGTEATFAPFEFMDEEKHEITGFDIDMIKAIAKAAGHEVKIQNMGFDGLIPSLQTNVWSCWTLSPTACTWIVLWAARVIPV